MKEILEKIGLNEFFAYICPGIILLSSLALWKWPELTSSFWKQEALVIILGLILSYTLGLILASFNHMAHTRYLPSALNPNLKEQRPSSDGQIGYKWKDPLRKLWSNVISILFYHFPSPRLTLFNVEVVEFNLRISKELMQLSGLGGLSDLTRPWERFGIYRTLKADQVGEKGRSVLTEADNLHRKLLFSMGMALAVFLLAIQSLIRLILRLALFVFGAFQDVFGAFYEPLGIFYNALSPISFFWLLLITSFGLWASSKLRQVAIKTWELETYLTLSLARSDTA